MHEDNEWPDDYEEYMEQADRDNEYLFYLDQERIKAAGPGYYNVPVIMYPNDDLPW